MTGETRAWLAAQADPAYRDFQHKLMPGVENYLGVRLPLLRKAAAQLAKGDWSAELAAPDETFEEVLLRGMLIGKAKMDSAARLELVRQFVPCIDNWAVCDSFCAGLRDARIYKEEYFELIQQCADSDREFEARFAAVLLLTHFNRPEELDRCFEAYRRIRQPDYYAWMGVAWGYSVFAVTDFEKTIAAMETAQLPDVVWNKALQKMRESYRIAPEQKNWAAQHGRGQRGRKQHE
ncbi:DNA alkylation repair protein [uncultured Allofournierella sp.]|uniref:DNA alkylation repair protein n=1 Tax=uncultured Allofournierella sp. TaxID=1940258 RepID=UPI0025D2FFD6|nr:DNA alkylation repair protein [uncultured Fournierella sp.]